jgi:hypothetical protein
MILGFQKQFVDAVANGKKPHSIRAGKRWREGMSIQFYTDVRQPTMRKIRPDGVAEDVLDCFIEDGRQDGMRMFLPRIYLAGRMLMADECQELARNNGFPDFARMLSWFRASHGLPFDGQLIHWTDLRY